MICLWDMRWDTLVHTSEQTGETSWWVCPIWLCKCYWRLRIERLFKTSFLVCVKTFLVVMTELNDKRLLWYCRQRPVPSCPLLIGSTFTSNLVLVHIIPSLMRRNGVCDVLLTRQTPLIRFVLCQDDCWLCWCQVVSKRKTTSKLQYHGDGGGEQETDPDRNSTRDTWCWWTRGTALKHGEGVARDHKPDDEGVRDSACNGWTTHEDMQKWMNIMCYLTVWHQLRLGKEHLSSWVPAWGFQGHNPLRLVIVLMKSVNKFLASIKRDVNFMVQQFEMKKSADAYARQQIHKTGVLNTDKCAPQLQTDWRSVPASDCHTWR